VSPGPAALLLAAAGTAALLAERLWAVGLLAAALLAVCLRAPAERRGVYLFGALSTGLGVLVLSPFLWSSPDGTILWQGPTVPVLGSLDVTTTELSEAALNGLRLAALGLAFAAYALLLDHDRLVAAVGVLLWRRWDWLAFAAFLVSAPQLAAWADDSSNDLGLVLLVLAAFWLLYMVAAVGYEVRVPTDALRSSSALLVLANVATIASTPGAIRNVSGSSVPTP